MPRYFFHLRSDHKSLLDCHGTGFPGPEAACKEARRTVQDFFQPWTGRVAPEWQGWSLEVCDERGRGIFLMAFADAARLQETAGEPAHRHASSNVVHLDVERIKRELASAERQTCELVRRTKMLVDQNRYEAKNLHHLMDSAAEAQRRARELVARSRQQTASGGGGNS
jgi:hypothetical protein